MDEHYEYLVNKLMSEVTNTQMTEEEYRYFSSKLKDKNVLVFGSGRDSNLYRYCVGKGSIKFLENDLTWVPKDSTDIVTVEYTTNRNQAFDFLNLMFKGKSDLGIYIPNEIRQVEWDIVFVDAPWDGKHGRMQSIYESSRLVKKGGDVFVHDCDRPVENVFSTLILGKQNLIKELTKLRHYKV